MPRPPYRPPRERGVTREAGAPGSRPQGGRELGAVHTRTNTTQRTHMRIGACGSKRGSDMIPSRARSRPRRSASERALTYARQYSLSSPPRGGAIEHSPLTPCLPLQARARRSRGLAAGSRSRRGCAGRCHALKARCGFEFERPSSGSPFVLFSLQVQSAPARSTLAGGRCDLPRSLPTREEAATPFTARTLDTPSEEGEGTDQ